MATGNTNFIYENELDKASFQHGMIYCKPKDLAKTTQSDKVLRDKAFEIASDPKYDVYQRGLASMVYEFLIKSLVEVVLLLPKQIINLQMTFTSRVLENLKKEKFIHHLETIFGALI